MKENLRSRFSPFIKRDANICYAYLRETITCMVSRLPYHHICAVRFLFELNWHEIVLSLPDIEAGLKHGLLLPHIPLDYTPGLRAQNCKIGLHLATKNN
jgi:hypothetical protein